MDSFTDTEQLIVFGQNIRKSRKRKNLTIIRLAELSGYDRLCLSKLEYGNQNIRYSSAQNLAKALDVPFPALFSRNFLNEQANNQFSYSGSYTEDDFMLVFIENFRRELQTKRLTQMRVYIDSGLPEATISRILKGKDRNPTLCTLCKMAAVTNRDLSFLFSRTIFSKETEGN